MVSLYYKFYYRANYILAPILHKYYTLKLRKKNKINVIFFAANLAIWRYQHLYELMLKHPRFNVSLIIAPFPVFNENERQKDVEDLKKFFSQKKMDYIDGQTYEYNIKKEINPDILFYPQCYTHSFPKNYDAWSFRDKLVCVYSYGFNNIYASFAYNNHFHNIAWKLFYPTECSLNDARELAYNKGKNVVITGYANADDYLSPEIHDVWKKQNIKKKRIIYAPHFTIEQGCSPLFFSNFLVFHKLIQDVAIKYSNEIQFAFKPHPRLLTELYKHKDWGEKKANEYYEWWRSQDNTQLETTGFIDLFKTSDAMIHDSVSFSVEYFYTKNPVMFVSRDLEENKKCKNEVGKIALDTHYIAKKEEDIIAFIDNVVLKGIDPMKQQREEFFKKYLLPPNGKTVAQNTMDDILKSIGIQ